MFCHGSFLSLFGESFELCVRHLVEYFLLEQSLECRIDADCHYVFFVYHVVYYSENPSTESRGTNGRRNGHMQGTVPAGAQRAPLQLRPYMRAINNRPYGFRVHKKPLLRGFYGRA